ncbi:MAG: hypothetical protein HUJ68_12970 [Clostridia bacterium]|nr:hypothetical protein [Clostridia bacterium]
MEFLLSDWYWSSSQNNTNNAYNANFNNGYMNNNNVNNNNCVRLSASFIIVNEKFSKIGRLFCLEREY